MGDKSKHCWYEASRKDQSKGETLGKEKAHHLYFLILLPHGISMAPQGTKGVNWKTLPCEGREYNSQDKIGYAV